MGAFLPAEFRDMYQIVLCIPWVETRILFYHWTLIFDCFSFVPTFFFSLKIFNCKTCSRVSAVPKLRSQNDFDQSVSPSVVPTLWSHGLYCPWNSPCKNTGVGSYFLLQRSFLTQGLNLGLLYYRQIIYCLSYQRRLRPKVTSLMSGKPCLLLFLWGLPTLSVDSICRSRGQFSKTDPLTCGFWHYLHLVSELS